MSDLRTPDAESPGEAMLAALLTRSHSLHPDDVPNAVADAAAMIGASDVIVYMIDYDQHLLVPLPRRGEDRDPDALEALDVDATIGGRAYRSVEVHDTAVDGGRRLWVPVLDGAERMGVLALTVEERTPLCERRCRLLASLVGELLVTKAAYGDTLELAKRRQPMELAAELRWSVLPPLTFSGDRVEITGILQPAYQIAGDSFDYALNGDLVHFAVIDAMGHGLEASRIANLAMGSYRHSRRLGLDLLGTLRAMDLVIADEFGSEKFVTGQLGTLDMTTGELHWLTAGHPRPLLLRNAHVIGQLSAEICLPIGLGDVPAEVSVTQLEPDDGVLFFTDGVVEARAPDGDLFGLHRLTDLLERAASASVPAPETLRRLSHAVLEHESGSLRDDATLLFLRWRGPH